MHKPIFTLLSNLNLPPINEWSLFEDFVTHYFNELEYCNSYKRFGIQGQNQFGFDVYSIPEKTVIQCKVKKISGNNKAKIRKELISELITDFKSFQDYKIKNKLDYNRFIFASTFDSDTHITTECAKLSTEQITVEYWGWDDLRSQMPNETFAAYFSELMPYLEGDSRTEAFFSNNQYEFDKKKPLIDQLYYFFKYLFSEVDIIPIQFFKNTYPFKISENFYPYYSGLTLTTDNNELFELFGSLTIEGNNIQISNDEFSKDVEDASEKLSYVLKKLSNHLIFKIQHSTSNKFVNIRFTDSTFCTCERCSFSRLEYLKTFKTLAKEPKDLDEKFLKA